MLDDTRTLRQSTHIMTNENTSALVFRPRARILQLLGDQLIGSPRLAVFELVKNGYDADATEVKVTLRDLETEDPSIIVEDNGLGMTLDIISNIWLVPAHDHRRAQRDEVRRTKRGRLPLGEKGLGRFAVHKLGNIIKLVTRAEGHPECVVDINWDDLINTEFLEDAEVSVTTREPEIFVNATGTQITITELRGESWTRGNVRRLFRQITSISSPFSERTDDFAATLSVTDRPEWIEGIPDTDAILNRAPWHFSFAFDGKAFSWKYSFRGVPGILRETRYLEEKEGTLLIATRQGSDDLDALDLFKPNSAQKVTADEETLSGIGPVSGEFFIFDRDRAVLAQYGDSEQIQTFLNESGGVRVYRDGMRVYNYGEPGDDWLGLDLQRVNNPTRDISRNIVVGSIDLSLEHSPRLMEKTNREGFVENPAYARLRQVVLGAMSVMATERKIDKDKIRLITGGKSDPETRRITKPLEDLRKVAKRHHISKEVDPLIDKIETDYNDMRETLLKAGLSGMGLAVVFHEVEHGVRFLYKAIENGNDVEEVQGQARELMRLLDGFAVLLRKGDRRESSLKQLVKRVRDMNAVRFRIHNIRLVAPALEESVPDTKATFAFGLALGALNNLIDNAIYWLKVRWPDEGAKPSPRAIYMNIEADLDGYPAVILSDTGPGFRDDPADLVRPFFTRRPEGMGVGLYYANMVAELNGGQLLFPDHDTADVPEEFTGATLGLTFAGSEKA